MIKSKYLIPIILVFIASLFVWYGLGEKNYVGDDDFVMREDNLAPDGQHHIIEFDIDIGTLGYSSRTAVTPSEYKELNLAGYRIPNCFNALGWTDASELIISVEECNSAEQNQIKTGDTLQGVKVQIVNADDFLLKQGLKRSKTDTNTEFHR